MSHVLMLNADGLPISIVPLSSATWQDSIKLMFVERVDVLAEYQDWVVHSPSMEVNVPSVMLLRDYVKIDRSIKFSKENVYIRDGYECQYCGANFAHNHNHLTQDHVVPRFLGGKTNWTNIVTACQNCNLEKAHYMKMKPKNMPRRPSYYELINRAMLMPITIPDESWIDYLQWPKDLIKVKKPTIIN